MARYNGNHRSHDYASLTEWIDAGRGMDRALANNTRAVRGIDNEGAAYVAIRYHRTEVVRFYENGRTSFNSGGWRTVTTLQRMNYAKQFQLWQRDGVWHIQAGHKGARVHTFRDGITFTPRGRAINAKDPKQEERERKRDEKLRKKIRRFAQAAAKDLQDRARPATELGDCFYCNARTVDDGTPLGDAVQDFGHLQAHMEEGYYPTALYRNAGEEAKITPTWMAMSLNAREGAEGITIGGPGTDAKDVEKWIYQYTCRRLLPNRVLPTGTRPIGVKFESGMTKRY